jgi:hypothetical protein
MPTTQDRRNAGRMERHFQSAVQALIVALLIWVGSSLIDLQKASASTQTSLAEVKDQIKAMNGRFEAYMPRSEAEVRWHAQGDTNAEFDRRLNSLEGIRSTK